MSFLCVPFLLFGLSLSVLLYSRRTWFSVLLQHKRAIFSCFLRFFFPLLTVSHLAYCFQFSFTHTHSLSLSILGYCDSHRRDLSEFYFFKTLIETEEREKMERYFGTLNWFFFFFFGTLLEKPNAPFFGFLFRRAFRYKTTHINLSLVRCFRPLSYSDFWSHYKKGQKIITTIIKNKKKNRYC